VEDIDWDNGVAFLFFKVEHDLKTEGSQAPFGLPTGHRVLRRVEEDETCSWVFPTRRRSRGKTAG